MSECRASNHRMPGTRGGATPQRIDRHTDATRPVNLAELLTDDLPGSSRTSAPTYGGSSSLHAFISDCTLGASRRFIDRDERTPDPSISTTSSTEAGLEVG